MELVRERACWIHDSRSPGENGLRRAFFILKAAFLMIFLLGDEVERIVGKFHGRFGNVL